MVGDPPRTRSETALKMLFGVAEPSRVIARVASAGGRVLLQADDGAANVADPEGNVIRIQPLL